MDKSNHILQLANLSIGYKGNTLVSNIDVSVDRGQLVLLLGANGMGKSTLLKTIAGQLPSMAGEIVISGKNIHSLGVKEIAKLIACLPGNIVLPNEVTVLDLLKFARIPYLTGIKGLADKDYEIINKVVAEIEIKDLLDRFYMSLSDGQKQLVNIARGLVQETPIISLDEPTAHLDLVNKRKVFDVLKDQTIKGKLIICSTHDISEGAKQADLVWLINKDGQFEELSKSELTFDNLESKLF